MAGKAKHPVIDGKKQCSKCADVLPFDAEHFVSQPDRKTGSRRILAHCKPCQRKATRAYFKTPHGLSMAREAMRRARKNPKKLEAFAASTRRYAAKLRADRPEVLIEANKRWRRNNPEKMRVWNAIQRAKRKGAPGAYSAADIQAQFNKQEGACFYCTKPMRRYHIEHKTPLSRGGTNFPDNIVCACAGCNLRKGTRTAEEFFALLGVNQVAA